MGLWKKSVLFYVGGGAYMLLELLWRGRSHGSMFVLGGGCFLLLGKLRKMHLPLIARAVLGGAGITALELLTGITVNRTYAIWDYRQMRGNFCGQICPAYALLWTALSIPGMALYGALDEKVPDSR